MKQKDLLMIVILGIFVALIGWFVTNNFIAKPQDRQAEIEVIMPFPTSASEEGQVILKNPDLQNYGPLIDISQVGNDQPFNAP